MLPLISWKILLAMLWARIWNDLFGIRSGISFPDERPDPTFLKFSLRFVIIFYHWLHADHVSYKTEQALQQYLKVFTNEKRGGLIVISFDRPPFKLLSRKFSKESVQAPSCERHKTTQRTLFLLFANNYWFPITLLCLAASQFWHRKLNWNIGIVHPPRCLKRR
jgi:hypothetical protein